MLQSLTALTTFLTAWPSCVLMYVPMDDCEGVAMAVEGVDAGDVPFVLRWEGGGQMNKQT